MAGTLPHVFPRSWKSPLFSTRIADGLATFHPILLAQTRRVGRDVRGATAIEYGLIAAGIAVSIIAVVFLLGDDLAALFQSIDDKIKLARDCAVAHANCGKG